MSKGELGGWKRNGRSPTCGDTFWLFPSPSSGFYFFHIVLDSIAAGFLRLTRSCSRVPRTRLALQCAGSYPTELCVCPGGSHWRPGDSQSRGSRASFPPSLAQLPGFEQSRREPRSLLYPPTVGDVKKKKIFGKISTSQTVLELP